MDDELSLTAALFQHYIEYFSAPGIAVTAALILGPFFYGFFRDSGLTGKRGSGSPIPGCRRFGLRDGQSNLADQYRQDTTIVESSAQIARVKSLFTYPIKSCRGIELPASEVDNTGLRYDRMFTFAQLQSKQAEPNGAEETSAQWQHQWRFITAREHPRLAQLKTELWLPDSRLTARARASSHVQFDSDGTNETAFGIGRSRSRNRKGTLVLESAGIEANKRRKSSLSLAASDWVFNGGCLVITFPFEPHWNPFGLRTEVVTIKVPLVPTLERAEAKRYSKESVIVWQDSPNAYNISNEIDHTAMEKLKYFLGVSKPLALFRRDDDQLRSVTRNLPADLADGRFRIGFSDSYSAHLLSVASVRALDTALPGEATMKGQLDARRFRANIYIEGAAAFEEDDWQRIAVGRSLRGRRDFKAGGGTMATDFADGSRASKAEWMLGCQTSRCTLPNVDPDTGMKDRNEPFTTLNRTRKMDRNDPTKAVLGTQLIPLFEHGLIRVGDEVNILPSEGQQSSKV